MLEDVYKTQGTVGGVEFLSSTSEYTEGDKSDKTAPETTQAEIAFRQLSAEIAQITQDVGDPMTVEFVEKTEDPHLKHFIENKN